ncbi:alternative ribosome rescue aminoacyl-tRNA hydrolase ArfB [Flavobacterium sp. DG1-102-2]|uniref:alternative ribosome rescue aminoacyl-tRNA hydrolase ArfB n=1 Tax=Flavobacterium sp. DG1-102-2 TaxID=3081663 RepID=UPI0029494383|nr:alternative ribosome rescue aminoacyl-tRNA hydrolase ArfB [Flavobacterium sp. DG1-102-2]MDV6169008.1 alternative ribosome rescue aminoacyl-tRNA hydrolase ArfB [Flavobacterium sp. DG1-102-2]
MNTGQILQELDYKAVRSSGAGGQNVNKVSSKVVLSFNLMASNALTDEEKLLAETRLAPRLTNDGILILQCDEDRSQLRNKDIVTKRFITVMDAALKEEKPRKPTRIPRSVIKKRIEGKRRQAEKKQSRRRPDF